MPVGPSWRQLAHASGASWHIIQNAASPMQQRSTDRRQRWNMLAGTCERRGRRGTEGEAVHLAARLAGWGVPNKCVRHRSVERHQGAPVACALQHAWSERVCHFDQKPGWLAD